jgi:hypothetical protein
VIIVVDASVAVKWVLREIGSDAADALLDHDGLIAPSIWLAEATNALGAEREWLRLQPRKLASVCRNWRTHRSHQSRSSPISIGH